MEHPWLHRYLIVLVLCVLLLIASGAYVTGSVTVTGLTTGWVSAGMHKTAALAVGALAAVLAVWMALVEERGGLRWQGSIAFGVFVLDALTGRHTPAMGVVHAILSQLFFTSICVMTLLTSPAWQTAPAPIVHPRASTLRWFALAMPVTVLLQVILGAAYRHKTLSIMPHMGGAVLALLLLLGVSVFMMQNYTENRSVYYAASMVLGFTLAQVTLGIAVFVMGLLDIADPAVITAVAVGHVATGALTLAASTVMAIQIRRDLQQSEAQRAGSNTAPANSY